MRYATGILCLACLCAVRIGAAGQNGTQQKERYVVIPPDQVLLAVAYQPDCPLKFDNAKLLIKIGARPHWDKSFALVNRGIKPIRAFTVGTSDGSSWGWKANAPNEYIMPGQKDSEPNECNIEIVPLTEDLRDTLKLRGPMKAVVILMVVRVEFADGSAYENERAFQAMLDYSFSHS